MVHPVPGTVLKIPVRQTIAPLLRTTKAKLFSVVILDKDVPVLFSNSFGMFAGKRTIRQPLKYSEIFAHPHLSGDAPRTGGAVITVRPVRTGYRLKTRNPPLRRLRLRLRLRGFTSTAFRFRASFFGSGCDSG